MQGDLREMLPYFYVALQGALYGAKALATGTGPLMFAAIFAAFTKTDSPLPYFPGTSRLLFEQCNNPDQVPRQLQGKGLAVTTRPHDRSQ